MSEQFPFIGRENELSRVEKHIEELGESRIIFINGEGGIGKTRLLQEIHTKHRRKTNIQVTEIFDFDDQKLLNPENMNREIADMIDQKTFEPFLRAQIDYHKIRDAGVSHEKLKEESLILNQKFTDCLNIVSKLKRVILFFDTTDHLEEGKGVWQDIEEKIPLLKNVVLLIAGRNAKVLSESLRKKTVGNVELMGLKPLSVEDSRLYLQKKQEQKSITVEPDLAEKLLLLSDGRPILIDLAVEWRTRGISLEWIQLSDEKQKEHFEKYIVNHIKDIRRPMDRLVLLLSYIYPLNTDMISELLKQEDAAKLFEEALTYVFVKQLPNGYLSLHDEMRRMVNKYVWPEVDPAYVRRCWYSEQALKYLSGEVEKLTKHIEEQKEELKKIEKKKEHKVKALNTSLTIWELEQRLLDFRQQQVDHTMFTDIDEGIKTFAEVFDEDAKYQYSFQETLLSKMKPYSNKLSIEQLYELNTRDVRYSLDKGEYIHAKKLTADILEKDNISPTQRVDMLIQIGNIEIRLGDYNAGIDNFSEAVNIIIINKNKFEDHYQLKSHVMRSRHALGWGYRMIGNFDDAIKEYEVAQELSITLDDRLEEAWILNDLALAYTLNGNTNGAQKLAEQADELWQELKNKQGLGALYQVYSEISKLKNELDESISHSNKALEIFEPLGDIDWLNRIYLSVGTCYWGRADLNAVKNNNLTIVDQDLIIAEENLRKSLESKGRYRIEALHYLGHVYLTKDRIHHGKHIDKAKKYFTDAYEESKKASLNDIELNSLGDLAYIAIAEEEIDLLEYFENKYKEFLKKWANKRYPKGNEGLLLKYLGDLNLAITPPNIDIALKNYSNGLPLISTVTFKSYVLMTQLKNVEKRLSGSAELEKAKVELGKKLYELWKNDSRLAQTYPEARRFFTKWQRGKTKNE